MADISPPRIPGKFHLAITIAPHTIPMNIPEFPRSWNHPTMPGYGLYPFPYIGPNVDYLAAARSSLDSIMAALEIGYRHLDTAFGYKNQDLLGLAIKKSKIPRSELFITSKLNINNNSFTESETKIKEAVEVIFGEHEDLSKHFLDSFLIHYPGAGDPLGAWRGMQIARDKGYVRHIGVSNFEIWHLNIIRKNCGSFPEVNQIEFHPWIYDKQAKLIEFCRANGIAVEGYSPLAQGKFLDVPLLKEIASAHDTTASRIVLKWCMQHGVKPIFGSRNNAHMKSNAELYNFQLSDNEVRQINNLSRENTFRVSEQWKWNPQTAPFGEKNSNQLPGSKD